MNPTSTTNAPEKLTRAQVLWYLVATAVVVVAALAISSRVVTPKNNQAEFGQNDPAAFGVLGEPRDTIDALFIGDSEAYCAFSPLQLWHEQGITSYACATSGQRLPYTLSLLERALKQQRPKVVVLETNCLFRTFTPTFAINRAIKDALPVFEYHNRWKSLRAEDLTTAPRTTWVHPYKGFRIKTGVKAADSSNYMTASTKTEAVRNLNRWYAERIAQLCRDNGASLVLMSTPSTKNWNTRRHNSAQQLAGKLGVDYIDLNMGAYAVSIDWQRDSCDAGDHLNIRGAQKVTTQVGRILRTTYRLPSHTNDAAYRSWNDAYTRYAHKLALLPLLGTTTGSIAKTASAS